MTPMESEGLTVWAPPELAAFYGGDPREQLPLRVLKAFYGLVHAPRKWFETVEATSTLKGHGWKQLVPDRCLYVLKEPDGLGGGNVVGLAGLHVDDFLLAGKETSDLYKEVEKKLLEAFRFGKWELGSETFEFAGCELTQHEDYSISLSQEKYVNRWVEEIDIDPSRSKTAELRPKEISRVHWAGLYMGLYCPIYIGNNEAMIRIPTSQPVSPWGFDLTCIYPPPSNSNKYRL